MSKIYLVNPSSDFPTYFNGESYGAYGFSPGVMIADLAVPTLAAMAAPYLEVSLCDQSISPVDFQTTAEFIGVTGKVSQYQNLCAIADEFRRRGKVVLIGGPHASLSPDSLRDHCDILVRGEIEELAPRIFSDLRDGHWQREYVGSKPSLQSSPVPRWDLYPLERALLGTVQTSRGCPFECEFCDVIQYAGRKQRHKDADQVLREVDELYRRGMRSVFLADDNFTVYRARAKELLSALAQWNRAQTDGRVEFFTQVSIDVAKDEEMLRLAADADLTRFYIGLETPNPESLRETKKRQNLRVNLVDQVHKIIAHGIMVTAGMIVGFDADGPDIFQTQYDFSMLAAIPITSVGVLVAPVATPLHARMKEAGRLKDNQAETAASPWATNIAKHPKLTETQLMDGLRWLGNNLYSPRAFAERVMTFIDLFGTQYTAAAAKGPATRRKAGTRLAGRSIDFDAVGMLGKFRELGSEEQSLWDQLIGAAQKKPATMPFVCGILTQYMQVRHMYETGQFWEPQLVVPPAPQPLLPRVSLKARPPQVSLQTNVSS